MQCLSEEPSERPTSADLLKTLTTMLEQSRAAAHNAHRAAAAAAAAADAPGFQQSPPVGPHE